MKTVQAIPGCCPFYDGRTKCRLTDDVQDDHQLGYKCRSSTNSKECGNYEAWKNGYNYTDWVIG
jgi:hypothetical protein